MLQAGAKSIEVGRGFGAIPTMRVGRRSVKGVSSRARFTVSIQTPKILATNKYVTIGMSITNNRFNQMPAFAIC